jgi:two-component system, OmpR family, alkaline phosphatase synthesis response regulator PhoP
LPLARFQKRTRGTVPRVGAKALLRSIANPHSTAGSFAPIIWRQPAWAFYQAGQHLSNTTTVPAKSRILIADDNAPNVELLEAFLAHVDCDIAVAVDGRDTLDKVASFKPDLILLDVMMPKLSGFEVCRMLKQDPKTKDVMVLMVTALNELGDIERAVDSGTDDFLSKPVNKLELLKRVENMLRLRHVSDELERLRQYIQDMEDGDGPADAPGEK